MTSGGIWLDSARIDRLKPEERGFGMVFQNYALFPHMSVRRNVGFGLVMRGVAKADIDRKVSEALSIVRLSDQGEKLPGQLSGGQQQRVAIARAIVIEPPLVLMDEPLSNLDAKLRLEMRAEIRRIHELIGSATIYVTHDQEEALSLADRIVVMRDGVVRQVGTPQELYAQPAYSDVAEFMGYRNLIPSRVAAEGSISIGGGAFQGTPIGPRGCRHGCRHGCRRRCRGRGASGRSARRRGRATLHHGRVCAISRPGFLLLRPCGGQCRALFRQFATGAEGRDHPSRCRSEARADLSGGAVVTEPAAATTCPNACHCGCGSRCTNSMPSPCW